MSKWDWIHATLEMAAYSEAQAARRNLDAMKTASEVEAARQLLLGAMKNFVFDISRDLQLLEEQISTTPQQAYIVAKLLDSRFSNSGLTVDMFPDFQDKEYVYKTQKKIEESIKSSKKLLSDTQIIQSDKAIQYVIEIPLLKKVIPAKAAEEKLKESEDRWQMLDKKYQENKMLPIAAVLWVGITLFACLIMKSFLGYTLVIGSIGVFAYLFFLKNKDTSFSKDEYTSLKKQREELQKHIMPQHEFEKINATYGDTTSEKLKITYLYELDFLNQVLGDETHNFIPAE